MVPSKIVRETPQKVPEYKRYLEGKFSTYVCNGGTSSELDVNNEAEGQQKLIDTFTQQILAIIGKLNGGEEKAAQLLESYKQRVSHKS